MVIKKSNLKTMPKSDSGSDIAGWPGSSDSETVMEDIEAEGQPTPDIPQDDGDPDNASEESIDINESRKGLRLANHRKSSWYVLFKKKNLHL